MNIVLKDMLGNHSLPKFEDKEEIIKILEKSMIDLERFYHGKTSGVDVKTVIRGGFCYFYDNMKKVENLKLSDSHNTKLVLIDTNIKGSTKEAVEIFSKNLDKLNKEEILNLIENLTNEVKGKIQEENFSENFDFKELILANHKELDSMGICIEENNKAVRFI